MQAILLAVVSALAGGVATVIPALLVSGRRRRANAVTEAAKLLKEVEGTPAEDPVRGALRVSGEDYLTWVSQTPSERANLQRKAGILVVVVVGAACAATQIVPVFRNEVAWTLIVVIMSVPVTITAFLSLKWLVQDATKIKGTPGRDLNTPEKPTDTTSNPSSIPTCGRNPP